MNRKAALQERMLTELAAHIDAQPVVVRLAYDDHHAGDRLALIAANAEGMVELHVWRVPSAVVLHVIADSSTMARALASWLQAWHDAQSYFASSTRKFAKRGAQLAARLGDSFTLRHTGFPEQSCALLRGAFESARPLVGISGVLSGSPTMPLTVVAGGLPDTLWGAAVPIAAPGFDGRVERALLFDSQLGKFWAPREVRVDLQRGRDLAELAARWAEWGLAGQPASAVEQPLAAVDYRQAVAERRDKQNFAGDCGWHCLDCSVGSADCLPCDG